MAVNRASERVLDVEQIDIALPADPNCDDLFVPPADLSDDLRSWDVAHRRVDRDYHRMMDRRQHVVEIADQLRLGRAIAVPAFNRVEMQRLDPRRDSNASLRDRLLGGV